MSDPNEKLNEGEDRGNRGEVTPEAGEMNLHSYMYVAMGRLKGISVMRMSNVM